MPYRRGYPLTCTACPFPYLPSLLSFPPLCTVMLDPNTPRSPKHQAAEQIMTSGKTAQVGGSRLVLPLVG